MSLAKVLQLAQKFAQQMSAQPEDIHRVLQRARLLGSTSLVSPLLERAQVPPHTSANIRMTVSPGLKANFSTVLTPDRGNTRQTLDYLLDARFGHLVTEALQKAKVNVTDPVTLDWLQITRLGQ